jgi:hypothetical protein
MIPDFIINDNIQKVELGDFPIIEKKNPFYESTIIGIPIKIIIGAGVAWYIFKKVLKK